MVLNIPYLVHEYGMFGFALTEMRLFINPKKEVCQ
jgi:hypothetical protein